MAPLKKVRNRGEEVVEGCGTPMARHSSGWPSARQPIDTYAPTVGVVQHVCPEQVVELGQGLDQWREFAPCDANLRLTAAMVTRGPRNRTLDHRQLRTTRARKSLCSQVASQFRSTVWRDERSDSTTSAPAAAATMPGNPTPAPSSRTEAPRICTLFAHTTFASSDAEGHRYSPNDSSMIWIPR